NTRISGKGRAISSFADLVRCNWLFYGVSRLFLQTEESHCILVEDVPFLFRSEKRSRIHSFDREPDCIGPGHLVRAEHHALLESALDRLLQKGMKSRTRCGASDPVNRGHVDVEL